MSQRTRSSLRAVTIALTFGCVLANLTVPYPAMAGRSQQLQVVRAAPAPSDSLVRLAEAALAQGRPWRATEILSPVIRDDARRTPAAVIVAARAATAWEGWTEAQRILVKEVWLDSLYSGEGRALLARAQLEAGADSGAVINARISIVSAASDAERGRRLVILARALAAIKEAANAAQAFQSAAELLPEVGDWIRLRSAEWVSDSAQRENVLGSLRLPHAVNRIAGIDAIASENTGDTLGAIARYTRGGNLASAFRLRLALARSSTDSVALRDDIMAALSRAPAAATARAFVDLFDAAFRASSASEDLVIAHALGAAGGERTAQSLGRALTGGVGSDSDRFQYATILARVGRNPEAINHFALVKYPPSLAAAAAYQRGRIMLRPGTSGEWREALRAVVRDFPSDTSSGTALFLLADLATDEGRDSVARETFLASVARYPGYSRAPLALFNAGMIAYVQGNYEAAAKDFESLRSSYPASAEMTSALYWKGRALEKSGDSSAVAASCARIRATDSLSYYSVLCSNRTGVPFWNTVAAADSFAVLPAVDSIVLRVRALREIDFQPELSLELDRIRVVAGMDAEQLLSAANSLRLLGEGSRAVSLAQLAQSRGARRDARLYRLLYPAAHLDMVRAEAAQHGLDMDLVAGLIRQESLFNPAATSPAGARGLMQIMPAVGGDLARAAGFPVWDPVLLYQPDVNARLGVQHFADLITSQKHVFHVLASYNAGASRVERWLTKAGTDDPEVFVERIPYVETRDYVRILIRNRESYRALYRR